ncbi:unnamed protein product [Amaranthus hypochondriacus]
MKVAQAQQPHTASKNSTLLSTASQTSYSNNHIQINSIIALHIAARTGSNPRTTISTVNRQLCMLGTKQPVLGNNNQTAASTINIANQTAAAPALKTDQLHRLQIRSIKKQLAIVGGSKKHQISA